MIIEWGLEELARICKLEDFIKEQRRSGINDKETLFIYKAMLDLNEHIPTEIHVKRDIAMTQLYVRKVNEYKYKIVKLVVSIPTATIGNDYITNLFKTILFPGLLKVEMLETKLELDPTVQAPFYVYNTAIPAIVGRMGLLTFLSPNSKIDMGMPKEMNILLTSSYIDNYIEHRRAKVK